MSSINGPSAGGKVMAIRQRKEALSKYYASPNYCKECGEVIPVNDNQKVHEIRKRVFCSSSCAASYNNRVKPKRKKKDKIKPIKEDVIGGKTKGELKTNSSNWQTYRSIIQKHAKSICELRPKVCEICGYDKHVEICHVKSVSSFNDDTLISEINSPDNLRILCRNCHWEHDNLN